jgi:multiple sugar transport system substrate-binding protein
LWHYYSGHNKEKFDILVNEFNETAGVELGIVVESQSQGDVQQLADAVFASAIKVLGQPHCLYFAAYADNAFRVNQVHPIVSLDTYFTPEELAQYRLEFLEKATF